jgi:hypothetical protein
MLGFALGQFGSLLIRLAYPQLPAWPPARREGRYFAERL